MALLNLTLPSIGQPNSTEDVDVVNAFSAIQTVINGNIDGANAPALELAFSTYKPVGIERGAVATPTQVTGGGTYFLRTEMESSIVAAAVATQAFDFDPADIAAAPRTTKLRLKVALFVNAVAPGTNIVIGLYPVTGSGGASGAPPAITAVGAVVTGSIVSFTTPAAGAALRGNSGDFTAPAAGFYIIGALFGGGMAANSQVAIWSQLTDRQV